MHPGALATGTLPQYNTSDFEGRVKLPVNVLQNGKSEASGSWTLYRTLIAAVQFNDLKKTPNRNLKCLKQERYSVLVYFAIIYTSINFKNYKNFHAFQTWRLFLISKTEIHIQSVYK